MMKPIKVPRFPCRQDRVQPSSGKCSSSSSTSASSSSPSSVLPQIPKVNKKQVEKKKKQKRMKQVANSSASTPPPLSPTSLRGALLRIRFADTILKAHKVSLEKTTRDPLVVEKKMVEMKRVHVEEQERVEAQMREAKRLKLEAKKRQVEIERERKRQEDIRRQRQRRRERLARDKMEAVAAGFEKPYCCTLEEVGVLSRCEHAWCWGYYGGKYKGPLEKLGLFIKEDGGDEFLEEFELEEGEIREELEEGEICC